MDKVTQAFTVWTCEYSLFICTTRGFGRCSVGLSSQLFTRQPVSMVWAWPFQLVTDSRWCQSESAPASLGEISQFEHFIQTHTKTIIYNRDLLIINHNLVHETKGKNRFIYLPFLSNFCSLHVLLYHVCFLIYYNMQIKITKLMQKKKKENTFEKPM